MKKYRSIDKKIKKKKMGLIIILLLLFGTTFLVLLTKTSFFHLSNIEIQGNRMITHEKIILASGLEMGGNIFKINTEMVEENLTAHPYIKSVEVMRRLPNKIQILLYEREETAVMPYIGSYIYIDEEGIILNILSKKEDDLLLEINGLNIENPIVGEKVILGNNYDMDTILYFLEESKRQGLYKDTIMIDASDNENIAIKLRHGTKVAFGEPNDIKYKLKYILAILQENRKNGIGIQGIIDFTKGDNPIFRLDSY